jgi:hypothetical protein
LAVARNRFEDGGSGGGPGKGLGIAMIEYSWIVALLTTPTRSADKNTLRARQTSFCDVFQPEPNFPDPQETPRRIIASLPHPKFCSQRELQEAFSLDRRISCAWIA